MRRLICLVTVCFMIISILSGCGVLQKLGLVKNDSDELRPASSVVMNEDEARRLDDKMPVHLYFGNDDGTKLKLEVRYILVSEAKKSPSNLASVIVKELINGPDKRSGLKPTIPTGTQLRSPVAINAGVATVDLTKEFIDNHPGGKSAEQITIFSIVNSLTQMKEIQKVKFLINGKPKKEFKGNYQFDAPFPGSPSLIDKTPPPTPPSTDKNKDDIKKDDKSKETTGELEELEDTSGEVDEDSEATYIELEEEEEEILE